MIANYLPKVDPQRPAAQLAGFMLSYTDYMDDVRCPGMCCRERVSGIWAVKFGSNNLLLQEAKTALKRNSAHGKECIFLTFLGQPLCWLRFLLL